MWCARTMRSRDADIGGHSTSPRRNSATHFSTCSGRAWSCRAVALPSCPMPSPLLQTVRWCAGLAVALSGVACGGQSQTPSAPSVAGTTSVLSNPVVSSRYVTVGFWQDATCAGAPGNTTAFPVDYGDGMCFVWAGRSGENSASRFECGQESFSYTQWTTLTCSGGQVPAGTRKTVTTTGCTQGVPPTQYARIVDFSGCQMGR